MTFAQARRELRRFVTEKRNQRQLAAEIGCGEDHLCHVFAGRKSFGRGFALRIQDKFQIPATAWSTGRRYLKAA